MLQSQHRRLTEVFQDYACQVDQCFIVVFNQKLNGLSWEGKQKFF